MVYLGISIFCIIFTIMYILFLNSKFNKMLTYKEDKDQNTQD